MKTYINFINEIKEGDNLYNILLTYAHVDGYQGE